jgi:hypothetical protein
MAATSASGSHWHSRSPQESVPIVPQAVAPRKKTSERGADDSEKPLSVAVSRTSTSSCVTPVAALVLRLHESPQLIELTHEFSAFRVDARSFDVEAFERKLHRQGSVLKH